LEGNNTAGLDEGEKCPAGLGEEESALQGYRLGRKSDLQGQARGESAPQG